MDAPIHEHRDYGFIFGLMTGTVVGAGLMMWLAPRTASEVRRRTIDSVKNLGRRASEQYQEASTRVGAAVDDLTRKGRDVRDDVADAVVRGARQVERYATTVKAGGDAT